MSWSFWRNTYFRVFLALTTLAFTALFFDVKMAFADDEISISFSSATVSLDLAPSQFNRASKDFSVSTTSPAGYTVSLSTTGSSSALTTTNNEFSIPTFNFPSGADKLPPESTGYGYGYSVDNGAYYSPIPDPLGDVKIFKTTDSGTNNHTLTFGAKVSPDTVAAEYSNTFIITAITNNAPTCLPDTICYRGNGDDGTGRMANQPASSNSSVMLIPSNFSRAGYGFAGWNTKADGTGTDYGAEETITTDDISTTGLILYAKWTRATAIMQNWTGCSGLSVGDVVALKDFRDDSSYAVAKLGDGKCWMIENMRINPASAKITTANTNSPTENFIESAAISSSTNNHCNSNTSECIDKVDYNLNNLDRSLNASYDTNSVTSAWYSYGGMYNWYTATAGNGTYSATSTTVSGDICPSGWRLPIGTSRGSEWSTLNTAVNGSSYRSDTGLRTYPNNFIYSGDFNSSAPTGRGFQGRFWSATPVSNNNASRFGYNSTSVTPANSYNKWVDFSVRCIVKDDNASVIGNIHYDANGGTGTMANTTNVNLYTTAAAANTFTSAEGLTFNGWNTKADGTGVSVVDEDLVAEAAKSEQIASGGTLTLYAMWGTIAQLDYDANGGSGAPNSVIKAGENTWTFTISSIIPTRMDYTFLGWSTNQSATTADYSPGSTFTTNNQSNTLYAVWHIADCLSGNICYRGNHADAGSSIDQSASSGASLRLYSSNYSRSGYGFAGWNTEADGTGTNYGPNQNITVGDLSETGLTLYAQWVASSGNLQNWSGCNTMLSGSTTALTDLRDNNTYTVTKLADGHCWMTENLRLVPSTANLNTSNTNSPTQDFLNGVPHSSSTTNMCNSNNSACIDKIIFDSNNIMRDLTASPTANNSSSSWYSYGVLYNWYTATAGNGTISFTGGSVTGDICPAGWRLPTGGNNGEYQALNNIINGGNINDDSALLVYPNNIVYSGDHNTNDDAGRGTYTRLWSSTTDGANNAFRMGLTSNSVTPVRSWNKWDAFAVRCIAK